MDHINAACSSFMRYGKVMVQTFPFIEVLFPTLYLILLPLFGLTFILGVCGGVEYYCIRWEIYGVF